MLNLLDPHCVNQDPPEDKEIKRRSVYDGRETDEARCTIRKTQPVVNHRDSVDIEDKSSGPQQSSAQRWASPTMGLPYLRGLPYLLGVPYLRGLPSPPSPPAMGFHGWRYNIAQAKHDRNPFGGNRLCRAVP